MDEVFRDEFEVTGFLSPSMADFQAEVRAKLSDWFSVADDVSFAMQRAVIRNSKEAAEGQLMRGRKPITQAVALRAVSNLQGAIIMAERGMAIEARTLARSVLEDAFCVAALHDDPDAFLEHLETDHALARKGQATAILNLGSKGKFDEKAIRKVIDGIPKLRNLGMQGLAKLGPLAQQYLAYRVLSNDGAHPSATSLRRHVDVSSDNSTWAGFRIGPARDRDIVEALNFAMLAALPVGIGYTTIMEDVAGNEEFGTLSDRYQALPDMKSFT